ncbi:hypothetical protein P7C73_g4512, partial [Tremellales sp. Uapishka_1]
MGPASPARAWAREPLTPIRGHHREPSNPDSVIHPERLTTPIGRSASLDSLPSLHPSLSDSINTLSRLIPSPPVPPKSAASSRLQAPLESRNKLLPEQRALLVRRTRKLEQVLGEPLGEKQIERLIVEPSTSSTTVVTRYEGSAWPASPSSKSATPEWAKEDCVPRRVANHSAGSVNRSGSKMAKKVSAALGRERPREEELVIHVERELRVAETAQTHRPRRSDRNAPMRGDASPVSPLSPASIEMDEDEVSRRARRLQLAKLHRLLGVPIPSSLVKTTPSQEALPLPHPADRPASPSSRSFISFDEPVYTAQKAATANTWSSKLRQTMSSTATSARKVKSPSPPLHQGNGSFIEMSDTAKLSEKEKQVARKRAQKLSQVFGNPPPQSMLLPSQSNASLPALPMKSEVSQANVDPFEAYQESLKNLLYLVDHDQTRLSTIIDSLDEPFEWDNYASSPIPPSPTTPQSLEDPDPNSHAARRRRTGKLSQFFGETGIDFTQPPPQRLPERKSRRETLDNMLGEMWSEVKKGSLRMDEVDRLGDLMSTLRRRRESLGMWEEL